ncbi:MAG: DUF2177 family protein [Pseudomonadota bacterium]
MSTQISMPQWAIIYLIAVAAFLIIDGAWLTVVMKPLFTDMLGDMLRSPISLAPAAGFYVLYVAGILFLAVAPALASGNWVDAAVRGAALGLLAYGTYDMTNLATLKGYKVSVAFLDTGWGGAVTAFTASVGFFAARWVTS